MTAEFTDQLMIGFIKTLPDGVFMCTGLTTDLTDTVRIKYTCAIPVSYTHLDVYKRQGPCTFNASRFLIGGVVLLPVIWTKERMEAKKGATGAPAKKNKSGALLPGGVCLSLIHI